MLTDTPIFGRRAGLPSDDDLARRFAAGDQDVLDDLYARYGGSMLTAALHLVGGERALAEEAVHSAVHKAWQAARTFEPDRPLAPWLFAIVRRCAIDVGRRERRHRTQSLDAPGPEPAAPPTGDVESAWEAWTVREALRTLPPDEHAVMRLAYYEQYTHSEIAAHLAIPIGTVKSRSARAHSRLRAELGSLFALAG